MRQNRFRIRATRDPQDGPGVRLYGFELNANDDAIRAADHVTMRPHATGTMLPRLAELDDDSAAALMGDLWHAGIRPPGVEVDGAAVDAKDEHIVDLRRIFAQYLRERERPAPLCAQCEVQRLKDAEREKLTACHGAIQAHGAVAATAPGTVYSGRGGMIVTGPGGNYPLCTVHGAQEAPDPSCVGCQERDRLRATS